MKQNWKLVLAVIAVFVVVACGATVAYNYLSEQYTPPISDPIGDVQDDDGALSGDESAEGAILLQNEEGETVKLSDYFGKPLVLNFWATWCGYCVYEFPAFEEAVQTYDGQVEFMMINLTTWEDTDRSGVEQFLTEGGYNLPVYYDIDAASEKVFPLASGVPYTVFIGADGRVIARRPGAMNAATLNSLIRSYFQIEE